MNSFIFTGYVNHDVPETTQNHYGSNYVAERQYNLSGMFSVSQGYKFDKLSHKLMGTYYVVP